MRKLRMVLALTLVLIFSLSLMTTTLAASTAATETYRCNGRNAGERRVDSHEYYGANCDIMIRQSYCTAYVGGISQGTAYHRHDHLRFHTNINCQATPQTICTHESTH